MNDDHEVELRPKNTKALWHHLTKQAMQMRVESYGEIAIAIGKKEGREIASISLTRNLSAVFFPASRHIARQAMNRIALRGTGIGSLPWAKGESPLADPGRSTVRTWTPMPEGKHLRGVGEKEQKQYEKIKEDAEKTGRYGDRSEEVAARTVMKQHKERGHEKGE